MENEIFSRLLSIFRDGITLNLVGGNDEEFLKYFKYAFESSELI